MYAFWFISFSMSAVVATAITTDYLNWDEISRDFMPTNELSRAFLASFILVMDLFIVMQVQLIPLTKGQENISSTFPRLFTISLHSRQNFKLRSRHRPLTLGPSSRLFLFRTQFRDLGRSRLFLIFQLR